MSLRPCCTVSIITVDGYFRHFRSVKKWEKDGTLLYRLLAMACGDGIGWGEPERAWEVTEGDSVGWNFTFLSLSLSVFSALL